MTLKYFWEVILIHGKSTGSSEVKVLCYRDQKVVNLNPRTAREPLLSPGAVPFIQSYFYISFTVLIVSTSFTIATEQAKGNSCKEKHSKMKQNRKKDRAHYDSQFSFDQCLESWVIFIYTVYYIRARKKNHIYD